MDDYESNEILDISKQKIYSLTDIIFPSHVKVLKCQECRLKDLDGLPKHIEWLDCSFNNIKKVSLPNHLKLDTLTCDFNQISRFEPGDLPKNLRVLRCDANHLETLEGLPPKIRTLSVSDNFLNSFKGIPNVYTCSCLCNYIKSLEYLQEGIHELRCGFNPINIKEHRPKSLLKIYKGKSK